MFNQKVIKSSKFIEDSTKKNFKIFEHNLEKLIIIYKDLKSWLETEKKKADSENKPLLIIISDAHNSKSALLIQMMSLLISSKYFNINRIFLEIAKDYQSSLFSTYFRIKQNPNEMKNLAKELMFEIFYCDESLVNFVKHRNSPEKSEIDWGHQRELCFIQTLLKNGLYDSIAIFGGFHLKCFFDNPIIRNEFHLALLQSDTKTFTNLSLTTALKFLSFFDKEADVMIKQANFMWNELFVKQVDIDISNDISIPDMLKELQLLNTSIDSTTEKNLLSLKYL